MNRHTIHRRLWLRTPLAALLLVLLALALTSVRSDAGEFPHERKGLVLGFNLGGGEMNLEYDRFGVKVERETDAVIGGVGRIGYGLSDHVVLSLEGVGFCKDEDDVDLQARMSLLTVTWYPAGGGFFLRGGIGSGEVDLEMTGPPEAVDWDESEPEEAFGIGLGYEWRLGRQFALGAALDARAMIFEDELVRKDIVLSNGTVSVQLNWYL